MLRFNVVTARVRERFAGNFLAISLFSTFSERRCAMLRFNCALLSLVVVCVLSLAVFGLTGTALASTITYDNFATDTPGSPGALWTVATSHGGTATIGNNDGYGQALELFVGWNSSGPSESVDSTTTWGINTDFSMSVIGGSSSFRGCNAIGLAGGDNYILMHDDVNSDGHWVLSVGNGTTNWQSGDLGLPNYGLAGVSKIDLAWTPSSVSLYINGNTTPTATESTCLPVPTAQLGFHLGNYPQPGFGGQYSTWADYTSVATTSLIPEPSTLVLFAMGLIGLLAYAWRRRK